MKTKNKLELTWVGKENRKKIEPRILKHIDDKSYGEKNTGNMLIHGDNLLALKSLEKEFSGKIKCIYIDPPYNTGSAFEHYDDNVEHSIWLSLMRERITILRNLLSDDGSIWISISDDEGHYLKVLCDEIFGRENFISTILWKRSESQNNSAKFISIVGEFILCYVKNKNNAKFKKIQLKETAIKEYRYVDEITGKRFRRGTIVDNSRGKNIIEITSPNGITKKIKSIRTEKFIKEKEENGEIYWTATGTPYLKIFLDDSEGQISSNWFDDCGVNEDSNEHLKKLKINFDFSKPEKLIQKIFNISTNENDYILDSFLGSGTTCSVAQKMHRKWIGIEMGEQCYTHCKVRIDKVINGDDSGGITNDVNWNGGGGYDFYELAPSLLNKDKYDNWVISNEYDADMLAEAMCIHNGFKFIKNQSVFFKQGYSTEKDFIFTTTSFVNEQYLDMINELLDSDETLLICCKAYDEVCNIKYKNINIQKIPQSILKKYEFGDVDYTLNVEETIVDSEDDENE